MQRRKISFAAVLVLLSTVLATTMTAFAASPATAGGITVSPGQLNFLLSVGTAEQTQPLSITNNYSTELHLSAEFKGIDETAGRLVPTKNLEANLGRSLFISQTDIRLAAHETQTLQVAITNPDSLSPGGHYATLVLTQQNESPQTATYRAAVSVSLYVIKVDGEKEHLSVTQFSTNGSIFSLPSSATVQFSNEGNVHVVPRAAISVSRRDTQTVIAKGVANQASLPLFPGKILTVTAPIQSFSRLWAPQRLDILVAYRADGDSVPQYIHRSQLYIPSVYPLGFITSVVALAFAIRWIRRRSHRKKGRTSSPTAAPQQIQSASHSHAPTRGRKIPIHDDSDA